MQNFMASTYTYHIYFCWIIRTRYLWMFEVLTVMWKMKVSVTCLYEIFVLANYLQSTSRELARPAAGGSSADWWPTAARLQCTVSGAGTWPVARQNSVYIVNFFTKIEGYFYNLHLFKDKIGGTNVCMFAKSVPMCAALSRPARSSARHCRHTAGRVWDQRQWLPVSTLHQSGLHQLELVRARYNSSS